MGELDDDVERGVAAATLQAAYVGAVETKVVSEGLLRRSASLLAEFAEMLAECDAVRGLPHISTISLR
nr:hypothetical protein [Dermabacter hominis]